MSAIQRQRLADARSRLRSAVAKLTTWVRFTNELSALRPMTLRERAADLRTARRHLAIAERRAATVRRLSR